MGKIRHTEEKVSFHENQIESGVSALYKLFKKTSGLEPTLFEDGENIFLQIGCIKVPKTPPRQIHLDLSHSLLKSDSEICLIVQDREDPKDYDNTIEYYEALLKKHDISNVKCIMPYHQFNNEYAKQFELKRKLASLYDFFLVDGAIHGYVVDRLGKIFYTKRKMPVAINMKATNLKNHFTKLLCKSVLRVHSSSDCYSVEVGNTKMQPIEVAENVITITEALNDNFPGGCENIRSLGVKTHGSLMIPLYLSLRRNKSVKVPVIKAKRPKGFQAVSGELTTYSNRVVTVLPSGEIIVKDIKKRRRVDDDKEPEFEEEQSEPEDEEKPETLRKKAKRGTKKVKKEAELKDEEESEDSNLEEAEESYLNFYKQEQVKMAKERKENKKNLPQNKKIVEESKDDSNLEDSDGSDFDDSQHPNFDESDESDIDEAVESEIITNFREKKVGNNKAANKKVKQEANNKNAKVDKMLNGSAKFENKQAGGKKGKAQVKKENIEVKEETKKNKKGKMEVIPIQMKTQGVAKGDNNKKKQEVSEIKKEIAVEKASGEKNKKLNKKQKEAAVPSKIETDAVPKQKKIEPVTKQEKKTVLTKKNENASLKQNKRKIVLKEEVVEAPIKKAKKEIESKSPKQLKVNSKVDKKPKKPNQFAKKAK